MSKRKHKYRDECKEAYDNFNRERIIGEVEIKCIPEPPPYNKIDNYALSKDERIFKKTPLPEIEYLEDDEGNIIGTKFEGLDEKEEYEFLKKLYKYRTEGYWFYNRDRLEYITGEHWYYLNVIKIDVVRKIGKIKKKVKDTPNFVDSDRNFFLVWQQVRENPYAYGLINVTGRRDGKSSRGLSMGVNAVTGNKGVNCGLQAQNAGMASSLFQRAVRMWQQLPEHEFFFPMHSGDDNPKTKLDLRPPKKRSSKTRVNIKREALYSWFDWRSTTEHAYDGEGLFYYMLDEASKIENCDVNELVNVVRETLADGSYAIGKMLITSTAENIGGKTLKQFEELWQNSNPLKTNAVGQTATGLIRYFKPASMGYRHDPEDGNLPQELQKPTIDKWGYSDEETARKVILALRKGKSGNRLIEFIRKYPLDVSEAFTYGVSESPFDTVKLNQQKAYNHDLKRFQDPIVRGNFEWKHGVRFGEVEFRPREDGRWLVQGFLSDEDTNCMVQHFDGKKPARGYCITGIDSFDHEKTEDNKFSKGAGVTLCVSNKYYARPTFVCIYNNRPPTPEMFYEDMLKQSIFYSSTAVIENQKPSIIRQWKKWGYGGFIAKDPLNPKSKTDGVSTRSEDTSNEMTNLNMNFIYDNVGHLDEAGSVGNCYFDELIEDWLQFNPQKRTKYDLSIASQLALLGTLRPREDNQTWTLDDWF